MTKEPESKFARFLTAKKEHEEAASVDQPDPAVGDIAPTRGRAGKRSNADFEQVTAYIRKSTHRAVKIALLQEGKKRQFSELVEDLLRQWVERDR